MQRTILRWAAGILFPVVGATGCGDDSPASLTAAEVIELGAQCFDTPNADILESDLNGTNECLRRLAADPIGRMYLVVTVASTVAVSNRSIAERIARGIPSRGLESAVRTVMTGDVRGSTLEDLDFVVYRLVRELEETESLRRSGVDIGGLLSFLADLTTRQVGSESPVAEYAASYVDGPALDRTQAAVAAVDAELPEEDWQDRFEKLATEAVTDSYAVALWAQPPVRDALVAAGATPPPESNGDRPIDPPLVDGNGALRIPGPDEGAARTAFYSWYREGGGKPLLTLARSFVQNTRVEDSGFDRTERNLVPALFSDLLFPES